MGDVKEMKIISATKMSVERPVVVKTRRVNFNIKLYTYFYSFISDENFLIIL